MPATTKPVKAIFLTVSGSGVALSEPRLNARGALRGYECESFGQVQNQRQCEDWLAEALFAGQCESLPLVLVGEGSPSDDETWEMWLAALERVKRPRAKVRTIQAPKSWRKTFKRPVVYAQKVLEAPPHLSNFIAEAMCLRVWAERAAEVHELLKVQKPKKRKAA